MNAFPTDLVDWETVKVEMNVTNIRKEIGNPSWETLMNDPATAQWQQDHILEVYRQRISEIAAREDHNKIYLFERCELDVNGYSLAFKVNKMPIQEMQFSYTNYYIIHRPIDHTLVYHETVNRPPEIVRDDCATYLSGITHTYGARIPVWNRSRNIVLDSNRPNTFAYNVHHSLNEGSMDQQIEDIVDFIFD